MEGVSREYEVLEVEDMARSFGPRHQFMGARLAMSASMRMRPRSEARKLRGWLHHRELPASGWCQQPALQIGLAEGIVNERARRPARYSSARMRASSAWKMRSAM